MKKKHLLLGILFSVSVVLSQAQPLRINSNCNPLVASIEDVAYVVRQDYALQGKDGVLYGQNNQPFFGFRYGPAVMWNGQLYISPLTYYAHLLDSNTGAYGSDYTAIPTKTYFKHIDQPAFTSIDSGSIKATPEKAYALMPDSLCAYQLEEEPSRYSRRAVVMTFECKDKVLTDTSVYKLSFVYTNVVVEPNGSAHLSTHRIGNSAHFALVFDEITEVGTARLEFVGFAEMLGDQAIVKFVKVEPTPEQKKRKK